MSAFTGAGVYYGAATTEAPVFAGKRVVVVGGGNSAGQAAMHLARFAEEVHVVIRGESLRLTMSQYLIDQMGSDRVALGSDYPFPLGETRPGELIRSMALPHAVEEDLFFRTAHPYARGLLA